MGNYQVLVSGPRGEKQTIDLCNTKEQFKSMTVLQLKEKIAEKFPNYKGWDDLWLIFEGKVLDGDSKLLSEFGIQHMSIIYIVLIPRALTVFIRCPDGTTREIKLQDFRSATVLFLKTEIRDSFGYPEAQQRLMFGNLEDSTLLSSYGIKHKSTIHLYIN